MCSILRYFRACPIALQYNPSILSHKIQIDKFVTIKYIFSETLSPAFAVNYALVAAFLSSQHINHLTLLWPMLPYIAHKNEIKSIIIYIFIYISDHLWNNTLISHKYLAIPDAVWNCKIFTMKSSWNKQHMSTPER